MAQSLPSATSRSGDSSFPSPLPPSGSQQAPSVISSRFTDVASEDGDEFANEHGTQTKSPHAAASIDPNRPESAMSSNTRPSTRATTTRKVLHSPGSLGTWRMGGAFSGPGSSAATSSRPESSASKTSRTHVPSLASHAFFRPMSSQRLQAQRGVVSPRGKMRAAGSDAETETNTNRNSLVTDLTEEEGDADGRRRLQSRDTEFPEALSANPTGVQNLRTFGKDEQVPRLVEPPGLNSPRPIPGDDPQGSSKPPRASRTLSTNFMRKNGTPRRDSHGHERLSSSNNSPTFAKPEENLASATGKNYQFFQGNTIFFAGGRLQNTRERPINVISAIIVILPSILFLVFS